MRGGAWLPRATACYLVQLLPQCAHILAHPLHHAPICVLLAMESSPLDCVSALHKSQLMYERTGGHVAGHMRTTSQPTTHVGSWTVCQTSRASFKRSVTAQIACLRSANRYWKIRKWCYCAAHLWMCATAGTLAREQAPIPARISLQQRVKSWIVVIEGSFSRRGVW